MLAVFELVVFGLVESVFGWPDQWWFGVWVAVGWCLGGWVGVLVVGLVFGLVFLLLVVVVAGVHVVVGLFSGFVIFGF